MSQQVRGGLFAVLFGLFFVTLGLVYAANLFGVASRHARLILARRARRARREPLEMTFEQVRFVARLTGAGVMLFGVAAVLAGGVQILTSGV